MQLINEQEWQALPESAQKNVYNSSPRAAWECRTTALAVCFATLARLRCIPTQRVGTRHSLAARGNETTQYRQSLIHECVTGKKRVYQATH